MTGLTTNYPSSALPLNLLDEAVGLFPIFYNGLLISGHLLLGAHWSDTNRLSPLLSVIPKEIGLLMESHAWLSLVVEDKILFSALLVPTAVIISFLFQWSLLLVLDDSSLGTTNNMDEGEDSMLRRVHPKKRSVSWVNSVPRQFLTNGSFLRFLIN